MKWRGVAAAIGGWLWVVLPAWCQAPVAPAGPPMNPGPSLGGPQTPTSVSAPTPVQQVALRGAVAARVLARVNGKPILFEEILNGAALRLEVVRSQVPNEQWPLVQEQILRAQLEETINWEVALQECEQRVKGQMIGKLKEVGAREFDRQMRKVREDLKFATDEEFRRHLERQGRSMDEMRRQYERYFVGLEFARNLVRDKLEQITREDLIEYYRANPAEFSQPELVTWQHLFIDAGRFPTRDEARRYAERLHQQVVAMRQREDFGPLAMQYSHSPDRFDKGEQSVPPEQIRPPELQQVVLALAPMQTGPVVETDNGFHVVRMISYQKGGLKPFSEVCEQIRRRLQERIGMEEFGRVLKDMKRTAIIEHLDPGFAAPVDR